MWYYYDDNGQRQGLINDVQLKILAGNGRIRPDTRMEDANGRPGFAKQIPGLFPSEQSEPKSSRSLHIPILLCCLLCAAVVVAGVLAVVLPKTKEDRYKIEDVYGLLKDEVLPRAKEGRYKIGVPESRHYSVNPSSTSAEPLYDYQEAKTVPFKPPVRTPPAVLPEPIEPTPPSKGFSAAPPIQRNPSPPREPPYIEPPMRQPEKPFNPAAFPIIVSETLAGPYWKAQVSIRRNKFAGDEIRWFFGNMESFKDIKQRGPLMVFFADFDAFNAGNVSFADCVSPQNWDRRNDGFYRELPSVPGTLCFFICNLTDAANQCKKWNDKLKGKKDKDLYNKTLAEAVDWCKNNGNVPK